MLIFLSAMLFVYVFVTYGLLFIRAMVYTDDIHRDAVLLREANAQKARRAWKQCLLAPISVIWLVREQIGFAFKEINTGV